MPANVEIKARVRDWPAAWRAARALADGPPVLLAQHDTFYAAPRGRLKLRRLGRHHAELIAYHRPDRTGPKASRYHRCPVPRPADLHRVLAATLGVVGEVRKRRWLFVVGQTRVHLDIVRGLGRFLELEVVLRRGQSTAAGQRVARDLMARLGIQPSDLVAGAYLDLLPARRRR